jgi:hypothetical protein
MKAWYQRFIGEISRLLCLLLLLEIGHILWMLTFGYDSVTIRAPYGEAPWELALVAILFVLILVDTIRCIRQAMRHPKMVSPPTLTEGWVLFGRRR